jgi:hypothetical protein
MFATATAKGRRSASGQAVGIPMVIIAVTIILVAAMFTFEIARTGSARKQLQSAVESAALAGAAALAGTSSTDVAASQQDAINASKQVLAKNDIFGEALTNLSEGSQNPQLGETKLTFQFVDPNNNNAPVPAGDPRGKGLQLSAVYGYKSLAGELIGLGSGPAPLTAKSTGGLGELDVVLCFDCSTSMRFKTNITTVRRAFNTATGKIDYTIVAQDNDRNFNGGMRPQLNSGINGALRGQTDNSPPGNFPPGTAQNAGFTDKVANLDERLTFGGFSEGGFNFPNVAALVEASRGNLENQAVFESSGAATSLEGVVTPQAGYKAKYFELARKHTHPFAEADEAAKNFFTLMNNNARAHFGLVAFSDEAGANSASGFVEQNVGSYSPAGQDFFPQPAIDLRAEVQQTNFEQVRDAISQVVPRGNTNIGAAINRAQFMFNPSGSRPNAKKAVILFTDGIPSVGSPSPIQACNSAADICRAKGIAVFTVGLNLDPSEQAEQAQVLNQITQRAGNGGKSFQVQNTANLNGAFAAIARGLTQLVQ